MGVLYPFLHDPNLFIAVRVLEGAANAAFVPAVRALVTDLSEPAKRGAAFGLFGGATSGGVLLGPAIGGLMASAGGFAAPFIFNSVSGVVALIVVVFWLRQPALEVRAAAKAAPKEAPVAWTIAYCENKEPMR
jgi:MFS family permease